jgi:enamidase
MAGKMKDLFSHRPFSLPRHNPIGVLFSSMLAVAAVSGCEPAPAVDLAITNGRVFTASGVVLEGADVRIVDGRIVAVGRDLPAATPRETSDATGLTVVPGLIDAHVHLLIPWPPSVDSDEALATHIERNVLPRLREYLDHGVTTIFSTGDYWPAIRDLRQRVESGEVPGPRIRTAGPVFTGPDGHPAGTVCQLQNMWCRSQLAVEIASVDQARQEVARVASEGADAIKAVLGSTLRPGMDPAVFAAIVEAAHEAGLRAYVHPDAPSDAMYAIRAGVDGLVHPPGRGVVPDSVIQLLADRGLTATTTMGPAAPLLGPDGAKRHLYAGFWSPEFEEWLTTQNVTVPGLLEAGIPLALGTDVPMLGPWEAIAREIGLLSEAGLTNEQILTAATRDAAIHLGLDDLIGTIDAGKIADLLLVRGNPLDDLSMISEVEHVIQNGEIRR